ncbi:MAG TPA: copper transporter [Gaiellaceae bacterium]
MFDFRYHVASLAAVFIALAVGILVGAAISGKLGDAEDALTKEKIQSLNDQVSLLRSQKQSVEARGQAAQNLLEAAYPVLMQQRLSGRGFAVLFVGPVKGDVRSSIERTLADSDSGSPVRLVALDTPIDPQVLDERLTASDELAHLAQSGDDFDDLGQALGREFVEGNGTPTWGMLSGELVQERSGTSSGTVDGAIVVRSWTPDDASKTETKGTESLFEGLLSGLEKTGVPVVGVETTSMSDTAVDAYSREGISSVDDVDTIFGRLALSLLLGGARPGHYGLRDSASDGVAPPIEPVTTTTSG